MKKKILTKTIGALVSMAGLVTTLLGGMILAADDIGIEKIDITTKDSEEKE